MLMAMATKAIACSGIDTHNWYLFTVVQNSWFSSDIQRQFLDNWCAYIGDSDTMYTFNAEKAADAARRKGDRLMLSYLDYLERYLEQAEMVMVESWDYPTKQDLNDQRRELSEIRDYAMSQIQSRLRSQHALLAMRCNMLMGDHEQNVSFWEQTACQMINSAYRDMMRNIYAGALLKTGRTDEATQIFIEQGDVASLYTYYYDKRSVDDIARVYADNPDSPAMPFLLQDFASNVQEAIDGLDELNSWPGKLYVNRMAREESEQMQTLCRQALKDGKTSEPALWKCLEAWLLYLNGKGKQAVEAISEAMALGGSDVVKENARVLNLYIAADAGKVSDDFMADELAWLEQRANETRNDPDWYDNRFTHVIDRLAHQVAVRKYMNDGRPEVALALMGAHDEMSAKFYEQRFPGDDYYDWNSSYSTDLFLLLDSVDVNDVERYLDFVKTNSQTTKLDRWLNAHIDRDEVFLHEVIGTKQLRLGQWQKAIDHLTLVPLNFISQMGIAPYMAQRNYTTEPWLRRQWLRPLSDSLKVTTNQKLDFAREMLQTEQRYAQAKGAERQQLAFQLAVRYYQASLWGDAWYLTAYGKSSYCDPDAPRPPFVDKATSLLEEAAKADDYALRERAVFALAFAPYDTWHEYEWNEAKQDIVAIPIKSRPEYAAMKRLSDFAKTNADKLSPYVSRCDVLKQFQKSL